MNYNEPWPEGVETSAIKLALVVIALGFIFGMALAFGLIAILG